MSYCEVCNQECPDSELYEYPDIVVCKNCSHPNDDEPGVDMLFDDLSRKLTRLERENRIMKCEIAYSIGKLRAVYEDRYPKLEPALEIATKLERAAAGVECG